MYRMALTLDTKLTFLRCTGTRKLVILGIHGTPGSAFQFRLAVYFSGIKDA